MREMKDSGIEWIGEIPKEWKIDKIKYHLKRNEPKNHGNAIVLSVYRDYGVIPKDSRDDNHNVTSEDTSKYKYVKKGQLVINKMKAWQGSLAVSDYNGIVSPAYFIYDFTDEEYNHKYFHYLVRSCYKEEFKRISGGIREGQWDLSPEAFANTLALLPPLVEQKYIANYLDIQCSEIDATAEDIQKEIALLEDYKKSVIIEAVTKGLNPDAEMKDSGIAWIGEIPKDWKVDKIKYHLKRNEPKNPGNAIVLSVYRDYGVVPKDSRDDNHNVTSEDTSKYKYVKKGQLVINKMKAWQGSLAVSDYDGIVSPAYFIYDFIDEEYNHKYFHYLVRSCYKEEFKRISGGIREGQWDLSPEGFSNTLVLLPSIEEQNEILDYILQKEMEIDAIIADKKRQRGILTDYKKSLIYEYVTGKKEVPVHE